MGFGDRTADPSPLIGGQTVAKKQAAKAKKQAAPAQKQAATVGEVAEYIGESLGDLMNRKDALVRQLADVNQRIASAGQAGSRLVQAVPRFIGLGRTKAPTKKTRAGQKTGNGKRKRPAPPDDPMVAATERARAAEAKGRAAKRARSSRRSGNR